ncbi:MAG: hypothetical protein KIT36_21455, partial [Alphaproteobacteria bacterium]|nr:hypothetical protein [Alphaproteobacteria bacterium]
MDGASQANAEAPADLAQCLAVACSRHLGRRVAVDGLFRHSGGASRETWGFDVVGQTAGGTTREPLVLRRDPPRAAGITPSDGVTSLALDRGVEFELLRAAE